MHQLSYQRQHGCLLRRCARIFRGLAVGGTAAYIADAYARLVMTGTMCAFLADRSARLNGAVKQYHKMIAHVTPTPGKVPPTNVLNGERSPLGCGGTVDDDLVDSSHSYSGYKENRTALFVRNDSERCNNTAVRLSG